VSQIILENSVDDATATIETIKSRFISMLSEHVATNGAFPAFPGARDYLQQFIASEDHAVGIATGCWRESAVLKLNSAGFGELDVPIATSDDAIARIDIMQFALSQLPGEFDSITYFGDGEWDQRATAELGWNFVAVGANLGGVQTYAELE
jgi:hypothetical protein